MEPAVTIPTLQAIAAAKLALAAAGGVSLWLGLRRRPSPLGVALALTTATALAYALLAWPLQRFFWGNNGDETFVGAYLTRMLAGQFNRDFFYAALPPFYPPLYFWVVGAVGRLLSATTLASAKLGVTATLLVWAVAPYLLQRWGRRLTVTDDDGTSANPWFWVLPPLLLLGLYDFDIIILKPYETLPAVLAAAWIGLFAAALRRERWPWSSYAFLGVTGGLLFLTYYFWWFCLIPAMFALAVGRDWRRGLVRIFVVGAVMAAVSLPYTLPLSLSFLHHGLETWQAVFTVPEDFLTFAPWTGGGLRALLAASGLAALIAWRRVPAVRGAAFVLLAGYGYQLFNLVAFLAGRKPAQMAKPFLMLGTAMLATGAAYAVVRGAARLKERHPAWLRPTAVIAFLIFLPLLPAVRLLDDTVVHRQLELDRTTPGSADRAAALCQAVPDFAARNWLSSGDPEINLYVPLSYYLAYNPHFSHPAAGYSARLTRVEAMLKAGTPLDFTRLADTAQPPVSGLLLWRDPKTGTYPIFLWQDNYPNGGKERRLDLKPELIDPEAWTKAWEKDGWAAYVRQ